MTDQVSHGDGPSADLDRLIEYAVGGLTEAYAQLARKGCWCPGAADEVCTLHVVQDVLATLASRTMPGPQPRKTSRMRSRTRREK